ncbi:HprK-related kinase B, partial [Myxococcota bacterium]|nr:HprK-related kinase B [Myxococcota bacterium]
MDRQTFYSMCEDLKAQAAFNHQLSLQFGECRILVEATHAQIITELSEYFRDFQEVSAAPPFFTVFVIQRDDFAIDELDFAIKNPDPGKTKIKEAWIDAEGGRIVRKVITGMHFFMADEVNIAIGPVLENLNQIINFINNRFIQYQVHQGYLLCHAAALQLMGKGVAIAGFSGAGKSTFALHLMDSTARFVSNDRLLVRRGGDQVSMYGVAKHPRINPGTIINNPDLVSLLPDPERYRRMPPEVLWTLEEKYDGIIHEIYGEDRFRLHSLLDVFIVLGWTRDSVEPMRMEEVELSMAPHLLEAIMKSPGLFFTPTQTLVMDQEAYLRELEPVRMLLFTGKVDFAAAARLVRD